MTSAEANDRIALSCRKIHQYDAMAAAGEVPAHDLQLMSDEISELERIAEEHPAMAEKLHRLEESWGALMNAVRRKLN